MFHYTDCGLDNVYLLNGFTRFETDYGAGYSIQDTAGLHRAIGRSLIETPRPLTGAELRFLRFEMELTQRNLGAIIGRDEQSVSRWERSRNKRMPGAEDRLIRALYTEFLGGDGSVRRMLERLADLDMVERSSICLRETSGHWELDPCMPAAAAPPRELVEAC